MPALKNTPIERKIINVTKKRQVAIPLRFYEKLRIGEEVEIEFASDAIMIRPHSSTVDRD